MKNYNDILVSLCLDHFPSILDKIVAGSKNLQQEIAVDKFNVNLTFDLKNDNTKTTHSICQDYSDILDQMMFMNGYRDFKITAKAKDYSCEVWVSKL